ncbi:hypothetical protein [Mycolicibacterium sp. CR10]|uniref:hypothetical protein n=1 Tax=Mycolicibacterium sp. CR10 TaxID=2562314 RepID=UPI0010C1163C|nr:hypothetical protein [Mycolicibacterium sp. CR10]
MGTPKARARWLRGALVGVASAVMTVAAHAAAGGGAPNGGALVMSLLACALAGTLVGSLRFEPTASGWAATTTALCAAQAVGHAAMATAGHHHGGGALNLSASMAATHIGAAVIVGIAITAAEYLYVVCSSVLCWLRLFATSAPRPAARIDRRPANVVVVQPIFTTGLGMRAPPWTVATA